jgi:hypothetical protein
VVGRRRRYRLCGHRDDVRGGSGPLHAPALPTTLTLAAVNWAEAASPTPAYATIPIGPNPRFSYRVGATPRGDGPDECFPREEAPGPGTPHDRVRPRLSGLRGAVRVVYDHSGMGQNFIACDRGQVFLMPPSLIDWVPDDHLVWTVLGAVDQMDLDAFYGGRARTGRVGRHMTRR